MGKIRQEGVGGRGKVGTQGSVRVVRGSSEMRDERVSGRKPQELKEIRRSECAGSAAKPDESQIGSRE